MLQSHIIFDKSLYRLRKRRFTDQFERSDFLHHLSEQRICERLDSINYIFENALIYGSSSPLIATHPRIKSAIFADMVERSHVDLIYDDELSALKPNYFDLIISILHLHHSNDLAGSLIQMRNALKPDGLLICVVAGVHHLRELRESMSIAEMQMGGISPRISPFMDIRDAGALLQRADFKLPVIDDEQINVTYPDMFKLMQELRFCGEANILHERRKNFTSRNIFNEAASLYQDRYTGNEGRVNATAHLLFLTGWKEHESQQQPAKRGSGKLKIGS
jgi:NADH dehydrogenase [ubiquinone] 1 alpha subcomplex assembly factor 5